PPCSTLFPYTTLFRSLFEIFHGIIGRVVGELNRAQQHVGFGVGRICLENGLQKSNGSVRFFGTDQRLNQREHRLHCSRCRRIGRSEEHTSELQSRENL